MTVNTAKFEESTEIIVDSEVEAPAAGWTLNYSAVNRVGGLVHLHIEATNAVSAAAQVLQLQADFAPGDLVTDPSGNWTVDANGNVHFNGSTAAGAKRILDIAYAAGQASP